MNLASLWKLSLISLLLKQGVAQYTALPRWGQATVVTNDYLLVHGGSTDQYNSYSYTSAPPNNDVLYLSLSSPFDPSSPPWKLVSSSSNLSSSQGPALAWHTLSAFDTSDILLFGGKFGANSPTVLPNEADSVSLLNVNDPMNPVWTIEAASWANQPIRRMRQSTSSAGGKVFLVGGERVDGSNLGFSSHYVFDNAGPSFNLLPSLNSPPDLSGHASVVLADGRLIVFGGYSPSQAALVPFTRMWAMDTTQPTLQWSLISITSDTVPPPRQAFATTLLNGNILIHGGTDAMFQNTYDDGWVLDFTKNPIAWSPVATLTNLGPRRDHFAAACGNLVIFGFGYGETSAAPADLQIYDASSGQWAPIFTPPALNPTNSASGSASGGASQTNSGSGSTTPTGPSHHPGSSGIGDGNSHNKVIAIGATLGVLGLIATGVVVLYFLRQRGNPPGEMFHMLSGPHRHRRGPSDDSSQFDGTIPIIGGTREKRSGGWFMGLTLLESSAARRARKAQERRDILADEDTRYFGGSPYGMEAAAGSTWSLRSVGAMIGERIGLRTREPSSQSTRSIPWREKSDPFSDVASLVTTDEETTHAAAVSRARGRRQQSYSSARSGRSYTDPFADPIIEETREDYYQYHDHEPSPHVKMSTRPTRVYTSRLPALQTMLPQSADVHTLSPLTEQASQKTESLHSRDSPLSPFGSSSPITSFTSHGDKAVDIPHTTSIIGTSQPPAAPMRRSDSWWSRFSRTSFLDRRISDGGKSQSRMLDIRDPNPPPRLIAIEESPTPNAEFPPSDELHAGSFSRQASRLYEVAHGKSRSSLQTTHTADTMAIERMGGMDVVQRASTSSHRSSSSTTGLSESEAAVVRPLLTLADKDAIVVASPVDDTSVPLSPRATSSPDDLSAGYSPWRAGGAVATRVQAYERRMSMEREMSSPPLSPVNTKHWEEKPRKYGTSVNYGLAPKPNLFITNPDAVHGISPSSTK